MRALCWKELRENYRWALLVMCGLGLAQWYVLTQADPSPNGYSYSSDGLGLDNASFLTVTAFGCPLAGLLLGLLQILPESGRDRWASLLHRPASRGAILRGKVLAGLLLYILATVPPLLFSIRLFAVPGHFPLPFVPEMTLAGVADVCTGAAYYFAGLALALLKGGWSGRRVFPLLAAVHVSYFVTSTELFRVAVTAAVLMALALFAAAWGTMLHQEKLAARPWLGRFACLAMFFYGACGLGDLARSFCEVVQPQSTESSTEYDLSNAGIPLRVAYRNYIVVAVTGLDGKPTNEKKYQPAELRSHQLYLGTVSSYIGDAHHWRPPVYAYTYRDSNKYLALTQTYEYPRLEQWFELLQQRSWVGYWPYNKKAMGRLDRTGFQPAAAHPEPLGPEVKSLEWNQTISLYDRTGIKLALLPDRKIIDVALPEAGPVYGLDDTRTVTDTGSNAALGVALTSGIAILDEKGALITMLPYHQDVSRWGQVSLGASNLSHCYYLHYEPSAWIDGKVRATLPSFYEEFDAKGQTLHTYTLPPLPKRFQGRTWSDFLSNRLQSPAFFFGNMAYQKIGAWCGSARLAGMLSDRWRGEERAKTVEFSLYIAVVSLLLATATFVWTRQAHFAPRRVWAWTLFVLVFNVAGFIAFRLGADWPQFMPCPVCGRPRSLETEHCEHCGAGWPAAPVTGTEIYDQRASTSAGAAVAL